MMSPHPPKRTQAAASDEPTEKDGAERGHSRRRDRWGRNRNGRNRNGRNAAEAEGNGHVAPLLLETREREPQSERHAAPVPVIAIQQVAAQPVEPRKWQPPAPTVSANEVAQAQSGLVEQARLKIPSLKLAAFDGETPPSIAVGFELGFRLLSEP